MVFFRAPTMTAAVDLVKGIFGLNGVALPQALLNRLGPLTRALHHFGVTAEPWGSEDFVKTAIWIFLLMVITFACPNTLEILSRYEPAMGVKPRPTKLFERIRIR